MNQVYSDLENNFPTEIDNIDKMQDVDISTKKLVEQYYGFVNSGDFTSAAQLIENNPSLKASIFNAEKFNMIRDMIISMQRFYKDDVRNYLIELVEFKDEYNDKAQYSKYDVVLYPDADAINAYMCITDDTPIGTEPTNDTYWIPFTYRGQQGASGAGLAWRDEYSQVVQYYKNDCVQYNGIVWCAKKDTIGVTPSSGASENWSIFMEITKQIKFSTSQPVGQVENDIWINTNTGEWKKMNASGSYEPMNVMVKDTYDPNDAGINITVQQYSHSKSGTVHDLTGTGDNIRFIATNGFNSGDTIKVNGIICTAKTIGGDNLWTGFFKTGAVVMCYKNGNSLTFNGGGLPSTEAAKLTPNNIKTGVSVVINGTKISGIFTADATAAASQILSGKTAYVNGVKVTGTIPSKSATTYTPNTKNQTIAVGQYIAGVQTIKGDANLISQNIKRGVTIFGITGSFSDDPSGTLVWCGYGETRSEAGEDVPINGSILQGSPFFSPSGKNTIICSKKCTIYISFNYWRYTQANLTATLGIYKNGQQVATVYADSDTVKRYTSGAIGMNPGDRITMRTIGQNASFRKDGCFAYIP